MKILKPHECNAVEDKLGLRCIACNNNCNIGEITKNLNSNCNHEDNNCNDKIPVYIVSHSSSILSNLTNNDKINVSIIGVACINNLIEGGWKISSYGIPPQCVILDYVAVKNIGHPKIFKQPLILINYRILFSFKNYNFQYNFFNITFLI
ncbi:DUF116 domain-containing protein [Methanobrevibacter arboriphilus]|uniref:DUF116 domain-containing protein n=1 Tax=Methanobrevibacter arboriphilus TaxID=39441 RepID=UPI000ACD20CD|nr:DUF116 domain-containing protein [Methanobrevibacter arboriphilus]